VYADISEYAYPWSGARCTDFNIVPVICRTAYIKLDKSSTHYNLLLSNSAVNFVKKDTQLAYNMHDNIAYHCYSQVMPIAQ